MNLHENIQLLYSHSHTEFNDLDLDDERTNETNERSKKKIGSRTRCENLRGDIFTFALAVIKSTMVFSLMEFFFVDFDVKKFVNRWSKSTERPHGQGPNGIQQMENYRF